MREEQDTARKQIHPECGALRGQLAWFLKPVNDVSKKGGTVLD